MLITMIISSVSHTTASYPNSRRIHKKGHQTGHKFRLSVITFYAQIYISKETTTGNPKVKIYKTKYNFIIHVALLRTYTTYPLIMQINYTPR